MASVPIMSPHGSLIAMISTHHNRCRAWSNERKLKLEELAHSTGRLLHDLLANARIGQSVAAPATASG